MEYAKYVNKGRGEVHAKNAPYLQYYDTKLGRWVRTKSVGPMNGIDFISETAAHLKNIGL